MDVATIDKKRGKQLKTIEDAIDHFKTVAWDNSPYPPSSVMGVRRATQGRVVCMFLLPLSQH